MYEMREVDINDIPRIEGTGPNGPNKRTRAIMDRIEALAPGKALELPYDSINLARQRASNLRRLHTVYGMDVTVKVRKTNVYIIKNS